MSAWPDTSATLIDKLHDVEEREAWEEFVVLYRPAVYRFARRMNLQHADAEDATQRVLQSVAAAFESRPPDLNQHRFRSWMAQVTRNAALKLVQRETRHRATGDSGFENNLPAVSTPNMEDVWQKEEQTSLYRTAAAEVKANCTVAVWAAFEQTAVHGRSPEAVAKELDVNLGVIYASRSRVLKRIRRAISELQIDDASSPGGEK